MIELHEFLKEDLVTEQIDQDAVKQFYDTLKFSRIIDTDAFHKAYDSELSALGLDNLFVKGTGTDAGLLNSRGTYGVIKDCANSELQRALKQLWAAQYADHMYTKAQKAENEARRKAQEEAEAKRKAEEARQIAEKEAQLNTALPKIRAAAIAEFEKNYPDLATDYKAISGQDLDDIMVLKGKARFRNSSSGIVLDSEYTLSVPGLRFGVLIPADKIEDIPTVARAIEDAVKHAIKPLGEEKMAAEYAPIPAKFNLSDNDYSSLYLLDPVTNTLYDYSIHDSSTGLRTLGIRYAHRAEDPYNRSVDFKKRPKIDDLQLIAATANYRSSSGRCYFSFTRNMYYNPTARRFFLVKCGVCFNEAPGGNGELGGHRLPDNEVPEKFRVLGLTRGEYQFYEEDSSD